MSYIIHHPKRGYWQATAGWFQGPSNATKYKSAEEAETVQLFNPHRFHESEVEQYKETTPCHRSKN